jgi:hypothetical protein
MSWNIQKRKYGIYRVSYIWVKQEKVDMSKDD